MFNDTFGNVVYQEQDLYNLIYRGFTDFEKLTVEPFDHLDKFQKESGIVLKQFCQPNSSVEEFDKSFQNEWFIPDEYKNMDIEGYLVHICPKENYQRLIEELEEFRERNMLILLKTLKYLVDTLRSNNIVWGVGRGSSVASYTLFLLGVHKINSVKYKLDWREFLR